MKYIYRPQTKFAKVMFLQLSVCPQGGRAWLLRGGMRGCLGGHAWLLWGGACVVAPGGVCGCSGGVCVVAPGGVHGCSWGGACVVARGDMRGCSGGMHGCSWGGVHGCSWGGHAWFFPWYMVNERAVRILLECILVVHNFTFYYLAQNTGT